MQVQTARMSSINYKPLCCYMTAEAWLDLPLRALTKLCLDEFHCAWNFSAAVSVSF